VERKYSHLHFDKAATRSGVSGKGWPSGATVEDWQLLAYARPDLRELTISYVLDHFSPRDPYWATLELSIFAGSSKAFLQDPKLAPLVAAARAYDDSLRQRYGLPARRRSSS